MEETQASTESETLGQQQQDRSEEGDSNTNAGEGGGQAGDANTRDSTAGVASEGANQSDNNTTTQPEARAEGASRTARNTPPTEPRMSPNAGAPDAGSMGTNATFNLEAGLGPYDVGYRVMEVDPRMQELSKADELLLSCYGDTIHHNDDTHLDGGVADDRDWQRQWRKVVSCNLLLWDAPKGKVGRRFIQRLSEEWKGVRLRQWNS